MPILHGIPSSFTVRALTRLSLKLLSSDPEGKPLYTTSNSSTARFERLLEEALKWSSKLQT
jgi:hypothetical protein